MQTDRTHPVGYALVIARACAELASDAANGGGFPTPLAAALSGAANSAALRLEAFLAATGSTLHADLVRDIHHAQIDLEAVAQIVGLAATHELIPHNAAHVARVTRYTIDQATKRLKQVEDELEQ